MSTWLQRTLYLILFKRDKGKNLECQGGLWATQLNSTSTEDIRGTEGGVSSFSRYHVPCAKPLINNKLLSPHSSPRRRTTLHSTKEGWGYACPRTENRKEVEPPAQVSPRLLPVARGRSVHCTGLTVKFRAELNLGFVSVPVMGRQHRASGQTLQALCSSGLRPGLFAACFFFTFYPLWKGGHNADSKSCR